MDSTISRSEPPEALLSPTLSIYLDCVRFLAALAVVITHLSQDGVYGGDFPLIGYGNIAVVIFFVLSGLVICSTANRPQETLRSYAIARVTRIYSVAVPAIILSFGCAAIVLGGGRSGIHSVKLLAEAQAHFAFADVASSLAFLNECWLNTANLPLNAPYWSLCYEVFYYVAFGIWFFLRGPLRSGLLLVSALIAGPAILVLLPLWALGALLVFDRRLRIADPWIGAVAVVASAAAIIVLAQMGASMRVQHLIAAHIPGWWRLRSSQGVAVYYVIGMLTVLNFVGVRACERWVAPLFRRIALPVQYVAGSTFSLYLFHRPIVKLIAANNIDLGSDWLGFLGLIAAIVAVCMALASVTERRRRVVRGWITRLFEWVRPADPLPQPDVSLAKSR